MPDRHSTGRDAPPVEEAVVTGDDVRRLVAQLPGTEERAHGGHPDFRVGGRIFACLSADEASAVVRLDLGEAAALAASWSGAEVGTPSPATTGMKPRPVGPIGDGNATKSSGRSLNAFERRATWSQATQISPEISGSCMKS